MTDGPCDAKNAARAQARIVRDKITDANERDHAAHAVRDRVLADVPLPDGAVAGYWPLGSELDVRPLLLHLGAAGRRVALPVSGPRGEPLTFRAWTAETILQTGRFSIREPAQAAPLVTPTLLFIPLLAFDRNGQRLGYGAGYYDRTLAALRADSLRAGAGPVLAVGVGFAAQEVALLPHDPYDQPLDWIVTECFSRKVER